MKARLTTIDDLALLQTVSDPRISPDGSRIAFVLKTMNLPGNSYSWHIWVVSACDGADRPSLAPPLQWTYGLGGETLPRWSPDGQCLAFVSKEATGGDQIYRLDVAGGEAKPITNVPPGKITEMAWSPDGGRLAFRFRQQASAWTEAASAQRKETQRSSPPREVTRLRLRDEGMGYVTNWDPVRLCVLDIVSLTFVCVATGERDCGSFCWSPDGDKIAYAVNEAPDPDQMPKAEAIRVVQVCGGNPALTRLDAPLGPKMNLAWAPDGSSIAYLGHDQGDEVWDVANVHPWIAPLDAPARDLTPYSDLHFAMASLSDVTGSGPTGPYWLPDASALLVLATEKGTMTLWHIPLQERSGSMGCCRLGDESHAVLALSLDGAGRNAAVLLAKPTDAGDVYCLDVASWRLRRLTHFNEGLLEQLELSAPKSFRARSPEGHTVPCWVFFPPDELERPSPLILYLHGGPQLTHLTPLSHELQLLVAQGYVVLVPDPRGSKGHGQAWTEALRGRWGMPACQDALACVDYAIAEGWGDPERLGIMGGSYGGYLTAFIISHTDRFAAAVAERGVYNLMSMAGTSDLPWIDHGYFDADVSEAPTAYLTNSPLTYAHNINTPLLLIHGEGDLRCPVSQSEELFSALIRRHKEAILVRYGPEANHGLARTGPPDLRLHRLGRILSWFRAHLHS